jgi:hypothetical protein
MKILYILIFALISATIHAQTSKTITIKPGEQWTNEDVVREFYLLPTFTFGKMYSKDGDSSGGKMNYNLVLEEMQFINEKNDTLSIADPKLVRLLVLDGKRFYYDGVYLQEIANFSTGKLAKRELIKIADRKKIGAMGIANSTGSIESRDVVRDGNIYKLGVNEELVLSRHTQYYFGDRNNRFLPANKKNLIKLFPKQKKEIENFLEQHETDFQVEEHLKNLAGFLKAAAQD